jgi:hypothetical protein
MPDWRRPAPPLPYRMSPKLPTFVAVAALALVATACGTLGKHYGEDNEGAPVRPQQAPVFEPVLTTAAILVDSIPSGAIIRMNGIKIGTGPVFARPEIDESGSLVVDLALSADYTTFALARNATEIITARYQSGDIPPRRLILARSVDGGVSSVGGGIPSN